MYVLLIWWRTPRSMLLPHPPPNKGKGCYKLVITLALILLSACTCMLVPVLHVSFQEVLCRRTRRAGITCRRWRWVVQASGNYVHTRLLVSLLHQVVKLVHMFLPQFPSKFIIYYATYHSSFCGCIVMFAQLLIHCVNVHV